MFIMVSWNTLLERFYKSNLTLQGVKIDLEIVSNIYSSLIELTKTLRTEAMFEEFIEKAKNFTEEMYEYDTKNKRCVSDSDNDR